MPHPMTMKVLLSNFVVVVACLNSCRAKASNQFGHQLLEREFLLNYTNFNHGSFGACPTSVLEYQAELRLQQEQQPDVWMREHYKSLVNVTRRKLANLVDAEVDSIVLTESASTAVNSVMRSISWKRDDIILYFSVAYGMVKNTIAYLKEMELVEAIEINVTLPISDAQGDRAFTDPFLDTLNTMSEDQIGRLRLVVLEHIVSSPAVREPIQALANLVVQFNPRAFVLVDGAHALGQIPNLSIGKMSNIDAYLSNGHKWLYSPKGSAFLWVNQSAISEIFPQPTVISSEDSIGTLSLAGRFEYVSTRDYTATVAMDKAIDFRNSLGGDQAIYEYVHGLAMDAKHYLSDLWQATYLVPDSMEDFMFHVRLPISTQEQGTGLQSWLLQNHNIYMIVIHDATWDIFYTRLSAQIYLEMSDFERLGHLVSVYMNHGENELTTMS